MRRAVLAFVSTVAALVLILSFKTHSTAVTASAVTIHSTATTGTTSSTNGNSGTSSSASTPSGSASSSTTGATAAPTASASSATSTSVAKTYTGQAADTRYGPVQVQITVKNGKITSAQATEYPENDPRDEQINSYAIPYLNQEAVQASSANIDMVSGATYTSNGYLESLQSAINQAGI